LAILTTARELGGQFEWAAHEPEALGEGISREIIEIIKHRKDTNGLDEADAIVIELGREIFGARKVTSATFARSLRQFGRRALVDLVALTCCEVQIHSAGTHAVTWSPHSIALLVPPSDHTGNGDPAGECASKRRPTALARPIFL